MAKYADAEHKCALWFPGLKSRVRKCAPMVNRSSALSGRTMDAEAASRKPRVLLCASGSVATVKVPEIALKLAAFAEVCMFMVHFVGARERASVADIVDDDDYLWDDTKQVKIVVTKAGDFFLQKVGEYNPTVWEEFAKKREQIEVIRDEQEWEAWHVVGDKVLHIEVRCCRMCRVCTGPICG